MQETASSLRRRLELAAELRREYHDVIEGRVVEPRFPEWCERRGWSQFLLGLGDEQVALIEQVGLPHAVEKLRAVPEELAWLCGRVRSLIEQVPLAPLLSSEPLETCHVAQRKRPQIRALVELCRRELPRPRRVVDVGAGLGHVTRALADALGVEAFGVELLASRASRAQALSGGLASFVVADASSGLPVEPGDLVVGLHACGGLGDTLLTQAAAANAHVALVSCCLQKVTGEVRPALSRQGRALGVECSRRTLGLSNVSSADAGETMVRIIQSRAVRHALRRALEARGLDVPAGEETRGVHRRQFRRGLATALGLALGHRGLPPATAAEVAHFEQLGRQEYGVIRRASLPRSALGRLLELLVALDRAVFLEERGHRTALLALVASQVTPRNLTLLACAGGS